MLRILAIPLVLALGAAILLLMAVAAGNAVNRTVAPLDPAYSDSQRPAPSTVFSP